MCKPIYVFRIFGLIESSKEQISFHYNINEENKLFPALTFNKIFSPYLTLLQLLYSQSVRNAKGCNPPAGK